MLLQETCNSRQPIQMIVTDQCDYDCDDHNVNVSADNSKFPWVAVLASGVAAACSVSCRAAGHTHAEQLCVWRSFDGAKPSSCQEFRTNSLVA